MIQRISISLYFFLSGLIFSSWASRIPDIKQKFNLNEAQLGGILFMLPMGALMALLFAGWLVHRFNSRFVTPLSLIVFSILLLAVAFSGTTIVLSVSLFFFGVLGNLTNISMNTQGITVQSKLGKPILSSLHAMWSLGAFTAAAFTGWASSEEINIRYQFGLSAILAIVLSVLFFFSLVNDVHNNAAPAKVFALPNGALFLLGLICFCAAMSEGAMADWSSLYFKQAINDSSWAITSGYSAFVCCMTIGRFSGDLIVERFGHSFVLKLNGVMILFGMIMALSFSSPIAIIAGFGLVGFGVSSVMPIVYMLAAKNNSMVPSTALAAVSSVGFFGFLLGPPIIGFIAEEIGLRLTLLIVSLLGGMIVLLTKRTER